MQNEHDMVRQENMDILKIIAMFMVVIMHALGHGKLLYNCDIYTVEYIVFWGMRAFAYPCVNCFVFTSAYFLTNSKINVSKVYKIWVQVVFYTLMGIIINVILFQKIDVKDILLSITPISSNEYWFITCYVLLYIFSPMLNKIQASITKKQHLSIISVLLFVFSFLPTVLFWTKETLSNGRNLFWFITLYFIAGYIRKYGFGIRKRICILVYIVGTILLLGTNVLITLIRNSSAAADIFYYNNSPFVVITSVAFFGIFLNSSVNSAFFKRISTISNYTLGIYLLHENRFLRTIIWDLFDFSSKLNMGVVVMISLVIEIWCCATLICVLGIVIEYGRSIVYRNSFLSKIERVINKKLNMFLSLDN